MTTLSAATASNAQILSSLQPPPHVVVAGGTAGIGRGIALTISRHCPNAHVTIIGRNQSAANEILSQLGSNGKFIRADLSLMSEIRTITKQINTIDILVLSQGILTMSRTKTKENIDEAFATNYYGRVLLIEELLPLLRSSPHGGKVLFVLNSIRGNPSKIHWNDMKLENSYSFMAAVNHLFAFTDLIIQYFASQPENGNVSFIHAFPGHVKTNIGATLPFYVRLPLKAMSVFSSSVSPEVCGEFMIYGLLGTEKGWRYINETGETVPNKTVASEEMLKKLWEHTCEITSRTVEQ